MGSPAQARLVRAMAGSERDDLVLVRLHEAGFEIETLVVPPSDTLDEAAPPFAATPRVVIEAWHAARFIEANTSPGDVVFIDAARGLGSVLALRNAMLPPDRRRHVLAVAGDGEMFDRFATVGSDAWGSSEELSTIDWERVALGFASGVLALSGFAAGIASEVSRRVALLGVADRDPLLPSRPVRRIWLPETPSRRAMTGPILRAMGSVPEPAFEVILAREDQADHIWKGTVWETLADTVETLGFRVVRSRRAPTRVDLIVLGDRCAPLSPGVERLHDRGVPVAAPAESLVAAQRSSILAYADDDELLEIVLGGGEGGSVAVASESYLPWRDLLRPELIGHGHDDSRARRVSVGIPVFRTIEHLDACVSSVIGQTQLPHEIILLDDGSRAPEVERALRSWQERHPDLIRLMSQANQGVSVARNTMLDAMTGDAFVFLDADDVMDPDFIEKTADALRSNEYLAAVATWTEFFGAYEGVEAKPPFDRRVGRRENPIVSTAVLADMAVRDWGVRFAPDLAFIYCEDWDFWSQVVARGGRFGLVPEALVRHRVHRSSGGFRRTELALEIGRARATAHLDGSASRPR
jgi:GT2 family glycosyltransferase